MNRVRVVFESEIGDGRNVYWIGRSDESEPLGMVTMTSVMANILAEMLNMSTPEGAGLTEAHEGLLKSWFETYLDHDRFASASDADLAGLLRPTIERIVHECILADRARLSERTEGAGLAANEVAPFCECRGGPHGGFTCEGCRS